MARPRKNPKSSPTVSDLMKWSNQDIARWSRRDERLQQDETLYELTRPKDAPEGSELVILNDPMVIIHKTSGMLSKRKWNLEVNPFLPKDGKYAQSVKDLLMHWDAECELNWVESGHNKPSYEEAEQILLRGVVAGRINIVPDYYDKQQKGQYACKYPWQDALADPANLYPVWSGNGLIRVTHRQWLTGMEIIDDSSFPDAKETDFNTDSPDNLYEIRAVYFVNNEWDFHGIISTSGKWLKKPEAVGYMPWIIVGAAGAFYRGRKWDQTRAWQKFNNVGILTPIREMMINLNRSVSMFQTMLAAEANPTAVLATDDPSKIEQVSVKAGAKIVIGLQDKLSTLVYGPNLQHYQNHTQMFQDRLSRATLPPSAYGVGDSSSSSMLNSQMIESAMDVIDPYIQALATFRSLKYRKALELFVEYFPPETTIVAPSTPTARDPSGGWTTLTAAQIEEQGYQVKVVYDTLTLQEKLAMANTIMGLAREGVMSKETGRGPGWLNLPNPIREGETVMLEKLSESPEVMKKLGPIFAAQTGAELLENVLNALNQEAEQQQNQPQPQGQGPTPPGVNAPQPPGGLSAPPPPPGVVGNPNVMPMPPASVVPPGMLGAPTNNPMIGQLMQRLAARFGGSPQGFAAGGNGYSGGIPPVA